MKQSKEPLSKKQQSRHSDFDSSKDAAPEQGMTEKRIKSRAIRRKLSYDEESTK